MVALFFILMAVSFTVSVFLMARFGFFKKENSEVIALPNDDEKA